MSAGLEEESLLTLFPEVSNAGESPKGSGGGVDRSEENPRKSKVFELGALARTSHFLLEWLHCVSLCIPFGPGFLPERFLYWGESGGFPWRSSTYLIVVGQEHMRSWEQKVWCTVSGHRTPKGWESDFTDAP